MKRSVDVSEQEVPGLDIQIKTESIDSDSFFEFNLIPDTTYDERVISHVQKIILNKKYMQK